MTIHALHLLPVCLKSERQFRHYPMVITALIGGLFGIPSLRLKGLYLAIATLAAQVIILFVISRWDSLTGGTAGMVLNRPKVGDVSLTSNTQYYYLCVVILLLTVLYATNLLRTRTGRKTVNVGADREPTMSVHNYTGNI